VLFAANGVQIELTEREKLEDLMSNGFFLLSVALIATSFQAFGATANKSESDTTQLPAAAQLPLLSAPCLSSIESLLDPDKGIVKGKPGIFDPISPRKLTANESRLLERLLRRFADRWSGTRKEIVCIGPDSAVRERVRSYRVKSRCTWYSNGLLKLRLDTTRDDGVRRLGFMWISIKDNWLRFGFGGAEPNSSKNPGKSDDVEILSIERDSLAFFTKYRRKVSAGSVQVQDVWSLHMTDRDFRIDQASYVQGRLVERNRWSATK